jgi:pimeloyl-ACP methyl ester carboxylesterase
MERLAKEKSIRRREVGFVWDMTEADLAGRYNLPMEDLARSIPAGVKVLCMHGTGDATIPWQESEVAASMISNSEFVTIDGADHNFTKAEDARQMIGQVVQFVLG